nr:bifunctional hydroxymethylpyrimidine kinase/phosphomethylpyrimidine kinase [Verrucomicrobiota bacterium]
EEATDLLFTKTHVREITAKFERGVQTHGTGCTFSAAITAGLATGVPLEEAITCAKLFVTRAVAQHFSWPSKSGEGIHALNHSPNESPD